MPAHADPVLSLAIDNISKIDKVDCDRLSSLWTGTIMEQHSSGASSDNEIVFTKCAENLENGRRLENLSWRLWYRECQLLDRERTSTELGAGPVAPTGQRTKRQRTSVDPEVPALSTSVDSVISEDEVDDESKPASRPALHRVNSKGQHLTPDRFHELVTQFGQEQSNYGEWKDRIGLQNTSLPTTAQSGVEVETAPQCFVDDVTNPVTQTEGITEKSSDEYVNRHQPSFLKSTGSTVPQDVPNVLRRASSVVHGFNPSCVSVKKSPVFTKSNMGFAETGKNMFFIESSPSGSDAEDTPASKSRKKKLTLKQPSPILKASNSPEKPVVKKHTSFREIVDEGSDYDSSPFDSDEESEAEEVSSGFKGDSAIMSDDEEEVDDDEWDSVCSESRANSPSNGNLFDKMDDIEGRPGLTSRKSILSTLLTNPMTRLSNAHSKSSPAIAQSRRASPVNSPSESRGPINVGVSDMDRLQEPALPTLIKGSVSPRTTRRNMLATELSESLRRHLLWERKQKPIANVNAAAQVILQRRHTAYDLTKVQKYPTTSSSIDGLPKPEIISENEFGYNGAGW